jgi:hypothetical protein
VAQAYNLSTWKLSSRGSQFKASKSKKLMRSHLNYRVHGGVGLSSKLQRRLKVGRIVVTGQL